MASSNTSLGPVRPPYQRFLNIGERVGENIEAGLGLLMDDPPRESVIKDETKRTVPEPPFYDAAKWVGRKVGGLLTTGLAPVVGPIQALIEEPVSAQLQLKGDVKRGAADLLSIGPTLAIPYYGLTRGSTVTKGLKALKSTRKGPKPNKYNDVNLDDWNFSGQLRLLTSQGNRLAEGYLNVPEGTRAAVRLNLQSHKKGDKRKKLQAIHTWDESTQSVERIGEHIGHSNAVPLLDGEFFVHQPTRLIVARGEPKEKLAAVIGNITHMSQSKVTRVKNSADAIAVMDPRMGNMFVDELTGIPVKSFDVGVAEGGRVYLKGNVQYYTPDELSGGRFFPENTLDMTPAKGRPTGFYNPRGVLDYQRGDRPLYPQYESELFDLRTSFREYPQFAIPYDVHKNPALIKKYEESWAFVSRPENVARIREAFDRGAQAGGLSWYNTEPLRLRFIEEFGPEIGNNQFAKFMGLVSAASSQTPINRDIHIAMEVFSRMAHAQKSGSAVSFSGIPGIMHGTHTNTMQDVMKATDLSPGVPYFSDWGARPKTTRFNENLLGNLFPITVDTHNLKMLLGGRALPANFDPKQYRYAELPQQEMAAKFGVPGGMYQSATWVGGETGVTDIRPFLELLEERIKFNAGVSGMKPDKWFKKWMKGDIPAVYSIGPIAMTGSGALIANELFKKPKDKEGT